MVDEFDSDDSRYDENLKREIAEDVKEWYVENTRLRASEIEIYQNFNHEAYVLIEIDANSDYFDGFESESVRRMTDVHLDLVNIQGRSLYISPVGVRE